MMESVAPYQVDKPNSPVSLSLVNFEVFFCVLSESLQLCSHTACALNLNLFPEPPRSTKNTKSERTLAKCDFFIHAQNAHHRLPANQLWAKTTGSPLSDSVWPESGLLVLTKGAGSGNENASTWPNGDASFNLRALAYPFSQVTPRCTVKPLLADCSHGPSFFFPLFTVYLH